MKKEMNSQELEELFSRGVGEFIDPDGSFRKKVEGKINGTYTKDIIIKFGVDPTRPDIHLGHAVVFRKLRKFQELGCKVIFLIGDFTAHIGDPTGKSKVRPEIEQEEIEANMKTYLDQVGKILKLDEETFSWIRNSDWFYEMSDLLPTADAHINLDITNEKAGTKESVEIPSGSFVGKAILFENSRMQRTHLKLQGIESVTLRGFIWTLKRITHARLIERDMFQERLKNGGELYLHEMMYPVLQGIDSSLLHRIYGSCDLEVGGTDQTFNMLLGRDVMKMNAQEQQAVLSFKLLEGTDGKEKMSKSLDNYVAITDEPNDMYGKVMSIPDASIGNYFELCTYTPLESIQEIEEDLAEGKTNPKEFKMRLAREIVAMYHGEMKATEAEQNFTKTFSQGAIPEHIESFPANVGDKIIDVLFLANAVASKAEARRLIEDSAVTDMETDTKIEDPFATVSGNITLRIGKKRFLKIIV